MKKDSVPKYPYVLSSDPSKYFMGKKIQYEEMTVYPDWGYAKANYDSFVDYGEEYLEKYLGYSESDISEELNQFRADFVNQYTSGMVLDIGVGACDFMATYGLCKGYDVNPTMVNMLKQADLFCDPYKESLVDFSAFTFWDSLEHIPDPSGLVKLLPYGSFCFVSLPTFENLFKIKQSKHYRPGEHLHYWTIDGLIRFFAVWDFECLAVTDKETRIGREAITSFCFLKS